MLDYLVSERNILTVTTVFSMLLFLTNLVSITDVTEIGSFLETYVGNGKSNAYQEVECIVGYPTGGTE